MQANSRTSLTEIAKKVDLSVDSVKKRINKMIEKDIFYPKIQLRPRNFGFNNIVDIKIKLHDYSKQELDNFIKYLKEEPHVAEIICISGEWDLTIVIIAKDVLDLGRLTSVIRSRFNKIIGDWKESLTTHVYKFEEYDMTKIYKIINKGE